jgi:hypothetical protein
VPDDDRSETELKIFRQIQIDVPRTNPNVALFQQPEVQKLLERILYIWAIRHPASVSPFPLLSPSLSLSSLLSPHPLSLPFLFICLQGYVQGINDLATPFFVVFLSELVGMLILSSYLENSKISPQKKKKKEKEKGKILLK